MNKLLAEYLASCCTDQKLINWFSDNVRGIEFGEDEEWFEFFVAGNEQFHKFYPQSKTS